MIDTCTALYVKIGDTEFTMTVNYPGVPAVGHVVAMRINWPEIDQAEFKITEVSFLPGAKHLDAQLTAVMLGGPGAPRTQQRVNALMHDAGWRPCPK